MYPSAVDAIAAPRAPYASHRHIAARTPHCASEGTARQGARQIGSNALMRGVSNALMPGALDPIVWSEDRVPSARCLVARSRWGALKGEGLKLRLPRSRLGACARSSENGVLPIYSIDIYQGPMFGVDHQGPMSRVDIYQGPMFGVDHQGPMSRVDIYQSRHLPGSHLPGSHLPGSHL